MNINRHNYEEFFLLYVDKELSAAERKAVDVFVQENPDLQGELLALQNTVVQAEEIGLGKKDWLFMEEKISAMQENLLLYTDDELTLSEKNAIEVLLATDTSALAEWNILQQTILQPDASIVFTDKKSLYRTEGARLVVFKWRRVAAAAVLLGVGLWAGVSVYKNNFKTSTADAKLANGNTSNPSKIKKAVAVNTITLETQPDKNATSLNNITAIAQKNQTDRSTENNKQTIKNKFRQNTIEPKEIIAIENSIKKPSNHLPKSYLENINRKESNEIARTNVLLENNNINASGINNAIVNANPKEKMINPVITDLNKGIPDPRSTAVIPVVYTGDENTNNRIVYMDEEKVKRSKFGGFIRQAKRVLERTTNIKTGDGLKVAGFEIALK